MYQYRLGHTVDLTIFTSIKPIRSLAASCVIYSRSENRRRFFISLNILDVAPEVNVVLSCAGTGANFIFFVFQASGWKCAQGETPTIGYILFFVALLPTCLIFFVFQASGWKCTQGETPTIGYILFFVALLPTCVSPLFKPPLVLSSQPHMLAWKWRLLFSLGLRCNSSSS